MSELFEHTEMGEQIAAAIKAANDEWARGAAMMDGFHVKSVYHHAANAVLQVLLKPTEQMVSAGVNGSSYFVDGSVNDGGPRTWLLDRQTVIGVYRSMIEAASQGGDQ